LKNFPEFLEKIKQRHFVRTEKPIKQINKQLTNLIDKIPHLKFVPEYLEFLTQCAGIYVETEKRSLTIYGVGIDKDRPIMTDYMNMLDPDGLFVFGDCLIENQHGYWIKREYGFFLNELPQKQLIYENIYDSRMLKTTWKPSPFEGFNDILEELLILA